MPLINGSVLSIIGDIRLHVQYDKQLYQMPFLFIINGYLHHQVIGRTGLPQIVPDWKQRIGMKSNSLFQNKHNQYTVLIQTQSNLALKYQGHDEMELTNLETKFFF